MLRRHVAGVDGALVKIKFFLLLNYLEMKCFYLTTTVRKFYKNNTAASDFTNIRIKRQ